MESGISLTIPHYKINIFVFRFPGGLNVYVVVDVARKCPIGFSLQDLDSGFCICALSEAVKEKPGEEMSIPVADLYYTQEKTSEDVPVVGVVNAQGDEVSPHEVFEDPPSCATTV